MGTDAGNGRAVAADFDGIEASLTEVQGHIEALGRV